jgi:NDP-sugar pyrophosphorylase family protein
MKDIELTEAALFPAAAPLALPYDETQPYFVTPPRLCGVGSSVLGKVTIGSRAALAAGSVIRADGEIVRIGDDFHLGEISTVHIAHKIRPTIIGDRVTVGRNAVVHACVVGDNCVCWRAERQLLTLLELDVFLGKKVDTLPLVSF